VVGAVGVILVLWAPVLWQQFTGDGNLSAIFQLLDVDTVPLGWLLRCQAIRPWLSLLFRSDLRGDSFNGPLSALRWSPRS
jgi:hypothetical protein